MSDKTLAIIPNKNTFKIVALFLLCVSTFIFHIWFRTLVTTLGYQVGELKQKTQHLESDIMQLKVQKNQIMGPAQLENLVRDFNANRLNFSAPQSSQLFYLDQENQ